MAVTKIGVVMSLLLRTSLKSCLKCVFKNFLKFVEKSGFFFLFLYWRSALSIYYHPSR